MSAPMTLRERVSLVLSRRHSWQNAIWAAIVICVLSLVIAAIGAAVGEIPQSTLSAATQPTTMAAAQAGVDDPATEIATIAQVMGGVYAILLAVVVFSVQLHAQREDENAFMVRYLIRRHGVYWVSAAAVGLTLANLVVPVAQTLGLPMSLPWVLRFDLVAVPLTLLSSLWLLAVTIRDATAPTFDSTFPLFKQDMVLAVAADQYAAAMTGAFEEKLGATRIKHDRLGGLSRMLTPPWRADFTIQKGRHVVDIDLDAVRSLDEALSGLPEDCEIRLALGPGETSDGYPCLIITFDQPAPVDVANALTTAATTATREDNKPTDKKVPHPAQVLTPSLRRRISELLNDVYVGGSRPPGVSAELNEFLKRFRERLLCLAQEGPSVRFEGAVDRLREMVQHWCRLAGDTEPGTAPFWFRRSSQSFGGPLAVDLYDVVGKCVESDDEGKVKTILLFLGGVVLDGIDAKHVRLVAEGAELLAYGYYCGISSSRLPGRVGQLLDDELHSILARFEARQRDRWAGTEEAAKPSDAQEQASLDQALDLGLALLKAAMEHGRKEDAECFFDRLFEHRRYQRRDRYPPSPAPIEETANTLHDYVMVIAFGWALHLIEKNYRDSEEAAQAVLDAAGKMLPARHELIALWELYRGESGFDEGIRRRLGVVHWTLRDHARVRSGVAYATGREEWIANGFYAALLLAESPHKFELEGFYAAPPPRFMWDSARLKPVLEKLAAHPALKIAEVQRAWSVSAVLSLVWSREQEAKLAYLAHVAEAPIDPGSRESLVHEIREEMSEKRHYLKAIGELGGGHTAARFAVPSQVMMTFRIPRDQLLPESSSSSFGSWIGENVAQRVDIAVCGIAELVARRGPGIKTLARLPDVLRSAARELAHQGYKPNLVLIPQGWRFVMALFQKPPWEVEDRHRLGAGFYGLWEGMQVVQWPYSDPESVVVADAGCLFGRIDESDGSSQIEISDVGAAEASAVRAKGAAAASAGDVPDPSEIQVCVVVRTVPTLGISDPNAAVSLDIKDSDGGYAMRRGEEVYHRPSCELLEGDDDIVYSLTKRLPDEVEDRRPCDACRPHQWDSEALREKAK